MADDSLDVQPGPFLFGPSEPPLGVLWRDGAALTARQQERLAGLKEDAVGRNGRYLARHPEIRAMTSVLLKAFLREKPRENIARFAGEFFSRPKAVVVAEIEKEQILLARRAEKQPFYREFCKDESSSASEVTWEWWKSSERSSREDASLGRAAEERSAFSDYCPSSSAAEELETELDKLNLELDEGSANSSTISGSMEDDSVV